MFLLLFVMIGRIRHEAHFQHKNYVILASLFFMGICIIDAKNGGPEELTLILFIAGLIVSAIGFFFVKD